MAFDPNTWTLKTQEAVNAAVERASAANNPEVTPEHLLAALLSQDDGIVLPIVRKIGINPLSLRNATDETISRLPTSYGTETRVSKTLTQLIEAADKERTELNDDYLSTEHLLLAL
ncbi:MAG: type VI secretion system ATPase TssH, partial [Actinobacteria bacterium]|nr:type VI secretion system ATPase TssH [Actinomycetota bacterium]